MEKLFTTEYNCKQSLPLTKKPGAFMFSEPISETFRSTLMIIMCKCTHVFLGNNKKRRNQHKAKNRHIVQGLGSWATNTFPNFYGSIFGAFSDLFDVIRLLFMSAYLSATTTNNTRYACKNTLKRYYDSFLLL